MLCYGVQSSLEPFQEVVSEQLIRLDAERKEQNFLISLHKISTAYPRVTDRYTLILCTSTL